MNNCFLCKKGIKTKEYIPPIRAEDENGEIIYIQSETLYNFLKSEKFKETILIRHNENPA